MDGKTPLDQLKNLEEIFWANPKQRPFDEIQGELPLTVADIYQAEERLKRFAPFIEKIFPETRDRGGIIESPLAKIDAMAGAHFPEEEGPVYLKLDSELAVAGSVKARGGIYEVLKHTEDILKEHGLLTENYGELDLTAVRDLLKNYTIQVGSTGNLGLSIGISSAQIGFQVVVHMSQDAKEWKKELLRSHGVDVREYPSDYSLAVKEGRRLSEADPKSYFIDDENSQHLFLGYAVAALRLKGQLLEVGITGEEPFAVFIPCGVGGAPGGITFGLKAVYGDKAHVFFVEPTHAPAMILGMMTGKHSEISAEDVGIDGKTEADGLAVSRPSGFVGPIMDLLLDGCYTLSDERLNPMTRGLYKTQGLFIEPSAAASFGGLILRGESREYFEKAGLSRAPKLLWATGGRLVPEEIRGQVLK
ncbi:MAG: D-serine ammonia-lyase [Tissierellia bacterium]|nr:D-serine ammonia-lyase [Tissierellia bacterium]